MTTREFANALRVDVELVRQWIKSGKILGIKIGSRYRIPVEELRGFIVSCNKW